MDRSLARLSWGIVLGSVVLLSLPIWPVGNGRAVAATVTAKDSIKVKQARQLYKEGLYEDAAKIFSGLSVEYPDKLAFTRNLGACYYHLRRPEPAISNLREYLDRGGDITKEDRGEVEGWISEMEKLRGQNAAAASAAPGVATMVVPAAAPDPAPAAAPAPMPTPMPPPPAASPASAPPFPGVFPAQPQSAPVYGYGQANQTAPAYSYGPTYPATPPPTEVTPPVAPPSITVPTAPAAVTTTDSSSPASTTSGRALQVAGLACGAAGLASIAAGIYFSSRVSSLSDKITNSDAPSASDYQAGKDAQTMQWVFYGMGALSLATGTILYYLGWQASAPGPTAIAPMVGSGIAGLSAKGAF